MSGAECDGPCTTNCGPTRCARRPVTASVVPAGDSGRETWLDGLEKALAGARPSAPWEHIVDHHQGDIVEHSIWDPGNERGDLGDYVAQWVDSEDDALLIIAAVGALPDLLRLARREAALRDGVERLAEDIDPGELPNMGAPGTEAAMVAQACAERMRRLLDGGEGDRG